MTRKILLDRLERRLREPRQFIQVLAGPRQVGKTTLAQQVVTYWWERNQEVDFVLRQGKTTVAIEVKSGRRREACSGESTPKAEVKG